MIEKLDSAMAPDDGLRWFNLLYLKVTQQVRDMPPQKWLAGPGMACGLDVIFANPPAMAVLWLDIIVGN